MAQERLQREIQTSLVAGMRQVTMAQLDAELQALGYSRMPNSRCACIATNGRTANTYPCVTYGLRENGTGLSAFHVDARRDARFRALQQLRFVTFAVVRGSYISI